MHPEERASWTPGRAEEKHMNKLVDDMKWPVAKHSKCDSRKICNVIASTSFGRTYGLSSIKWGEPHCLPYVSFLLFSFIFSKNFYIFINKYYIYYILMRIE